MKISVIGGAGVRVPLLIGGLSRSDLGITDIALYDTDQQRLAVIAGLAAQMAAGARVTTHASPEPAIEGADFVITSIRAGGISQRARDEATAVAHGIVGQETVGPAGFAMAVRSIPPLVSYGRMVARLAPRAWMINFTNPVSIITQAVHQESDAKLIGICDTPLEMFEDAAHALGLPATVCGYDYFGLNHLGWLRDVIFEGEGQLHRIWDDDAKLKAAYRAPLFELERLRGLRLLPTEYLYYYYRPDVALENIKKAGSGRGQAVAKLTDEFFKNPTLENYQLYLTKRDSSYMQLETGSAPRIKPDWAELSGYDRIALFTIRAIVKDQGAMLPLDVPNRGTFPFLANDDIVEVQCRVDKDGPRPQAIAPIPDHPRELMTTIKRYERATIDAALTGDRGQLANALALNPLVPSNQTAAQLVAALFP